jgi:transcriptional regulator GlxA family with amidase domain
MVAFEQANIVDVTGPLEVFSVANRVLEASRPDAPRYRIEVVAPVAGEVMMSCGVAVVAARALRTLRGPIDTLMVAGGMGTREAVFDRDLIGGVARLAARARRVASVCTGAFLLAEAGLLDGRRAVTHWGSCDALADRYPELDVEPDRIFVRDGDVWSSAGVTAGLDLALALVEDDHDTRTALQVARSMVVYLKRPGGQSQFSAQLDAQLASREPLRDAQAYVHEHPEADLSVAALARNAAMSPRHFARAFAAEVGITPARYVERARVEAARRRLEESTRSVDEVAAQCGFGSAETMRRAFLRVLRVAPSAYRSRFHAEGRRA